MEPLFSYWHFDPVILLFLAGVGIAYGVTVHFRWPKKAWCLAAAGLVILLCTASPLHFLGEHYLFSAHMVSHVLLLLVAGPLLAASIPEDNRFREPLQRFSRELHKAPLIGWLSGVAIMWFWHVPAIFHQLFVMHASASPHLMGWLMYCHIMSSLLAGILFSWPVIGPYKGERLGALPCVLYLSTACLFCSLLGLIITFAHPGTYTGYIGGADPYGFLSVIRNDWNISAAADQQMAGLIMWVPCCFIYLSASMFLLVRWFNESPVKAPGPTSPGLSSFEHLNVRH